MAGCHDMIDMIDTDRGVVQFKSRAGRYLVL